MSLSEFPIQASMPSQLLISTICFLTKPFCYVYKVKKKTLMLHQDIAACIVGLLQFINLCTRECLSPIGGRALKYEVCKNSYDTEVKSTTVESLIKVNTSAWLSYSVSCNEPLVS